LASRLDAGETVPTGVGAEPLKNGGLYGKRSAGRQRIPGARSSQPLGDPPAQRLG